MPSYTFFFARETNLSFWWDWEKFSQKVCPVIWFFAVETILSFWGDLESFDKKMCPVTLFFAVETNLSFWWEFEKFSQKSVPSHTFLRCGDYLKCLRWTWKVSTKSCDQLHIFFSLWKLIWVFDGTGKNFHKKVCPVICFFAVETILSVWVDLESFDKKVCPVICFFAVETILSFWGDLESFDKEISAQLHVFFSLWRLTWVFEGTWKNFHKKSVPSHMFLRCGDYLKFLMGLRKNFHKNVCPVTRFFSVETNLSFWWDLEKFSQKSVHSHTFLRCGDYLKFLRGLGKFRQRDVPSYTFFFAVETNLSFWRDLEKFSQKKCAQSYVSSLWRLSQVFDGA